MSRLFLLGLIVGNLWWSAHPIMGKILLESFTAAEVAWLRYFSAWLTLMIVGLGLLLRGTMLMQPRPVLSLSHATLSKRSMLIICAVGVMNFCLAPWLQLSGLAASEASDNSLIVAMEPLLTLLLARLFLGTQLSTRDRWGLVLAFSGFLILTGYENLAHVNLRFLGNMALLLSLLGEATFSVGNTKLLSLGWRPMWSLVISLSIGVMLLSTVFGLNQEINFSTLMARMSFREWGAVLWLGPVGTALSYLFWIYALERLTLTAVSLSLFIQPLFGSFLAAVYLKETLELKVYMGGVLILLALWISALQKRKQ